MGFQDVIRLIQDGDPVTAGVANGPTQALDQNVRYLRDLLQAAATGATVYARQVTVEAAALPGMPVYWEPRTQRFERCLARAEAAPVSGALVTAESARPWGIVGAKTSATLADLLLVGYDAIDLTAAVGGAVQPGVYYLSGTTPGMLVTQRPPVSVAVLRADGAGKVYVLPQFIDFLERHVHYRFPLVCAPAGSVTPPVPGERHTITAPDPALPGWLPAFDPVFNNRAPAGAAFGYNLKADPALDQVWPPIPVEQATLEWDRGIDKDVAATAVPLGPSGLCVLDRDGIWWMSNCYGDVPWPTTLDTANGTSQSVSLSEIECPRQLTMALTLWFTRLNFASDLVAVTSLRAGDDRIVLRCPDGTTGVMGDLEITLNLDWTTETGVTGFEVLKTLHGSTFQSGPVCEGVYAASSNVSLTGAASRPLAGPGSPTLYQGPVGISVARATTREIEVQQIRLDGVEEEFYLDVPYLGFQPGRAASVRGTLYIPADTELVGPTLGLRFVLLGRALGTLPPLTLTARRLPRPPSALATPVQLPVESDEFTVTLTTAATLSLGSQYVEASSAGFTVAPGDIVLFSLGRGAADGYPAEVGLLHAVGVLAAGA